MIKKTFKYLLSLFILGLGCINFSYGLGINDINQDNAISGTINNNSISYIKTYNAYGPTYVGIDNGFNFHSKFIDEDMDLIGVVGAYNAYRGVLFWNNNNLYNAMYFYNTNNPNSFSLSSLLKTTRVSICDGTYNNCTKTDVSYFVNLQEQGIYFTDYYLNYLGYDNDEILVICGKYSDSSSVCINGSARNGRSLFSDMSYVDKTQFAPYTPSLYENLYFFTYIAEESPVPVHNSGGGGVGQRFPTRPIRTLSGNVMVSEYTNGEVLQGYFNLGYKKNMCYNPYTNLNDITSYQGYSTGMNLFEMLDRYNGNTYVSVSGSYSYYSQNPDLLDSFLSSLSNSYIRDFSGNYFNGFSSPAVWNNTPIWWQGYFYYNFYHLYTDGILSIDSENLLDFCNLLLNTDLEIDGVYSGSLPPNFTRPVYSSNEVGMGFSFGTGETLIGQLGSGVNMDFGLEDFAQFVDEKFTSIFDVKASDFKNQGIIPEYILWFIVMFLLIKFFRK